MKDSLIKLELATLNYLQRMVELNWKNWKNAKDNHIRLKRIEHHLFEIGLLITELEKDII